MKLKSFLCAPLLSFACFSVFASTVDTVYCPSKITCIRSPDGHKGSCTLEGSDEKYWQSPQRSTVVSDSAYPNVIYTVIPEGTYEFVSVTAPYHNSNPEAVGCYYMPGGATPHTWQPNLMLYSTFAANLEMYKPADTKTFWRKDPKNAADFYCSTADLSGNRGGTEVCPLKAQSALAVINTNYADPVYLMDTDGYHITTTFPYENYFKVDYARALSACGSKSLCTFNLFSSNMHYQFDSRHIGSVTVDMNNRMKIVEVTSLDNNVLINQVSDLGGIEIIDTRNGNPLSLVNETKANIITTVGDQHVSDYSSNIIYPSKLAEYCGDVGVCQIDLSVAGGSVGNVGSVTVDTRDFTFIATQSYRPSEMVVTLVDKRTVKVSFPFPM